MSNVILNPGAGGATLGTDTVGGVDYQISKIGFSAAGAAPTQVSLTNPLPDNIAQVGGTAVDTNSGAKSAGTLRVVLATDQPALTAALKVDGSAVTQPISAAALPLPAGAATVAKQPALGTAGTPSADVLSVQGVASMTALKVDGSGVTQPVSGTVTTSPPANATTNLTQVVGTAVDVNSGAKSAGTIRVVLATDQPALTNKLLVTPDSVALPANQSVNMNQVAGTATDTNSGVKSAGTLRVVLATDQPALTNKLLVTPDSVALPANQSVNQAQVAGTTTDTNSGNKSAGTQRVVIATDQPTLSNGQPAIQSGTWTVQPGNTPNSTPWLVTDTPATSGGLSFNGFVGAATNNKTQIKASAGQLYFVSVQNLAATPVYLKVFNNTSAGVTMGTTNCDFQFMIPGNTAGAGVVLNIDKGLAMGTGITIALTAGIATNDNTSVVVNNQVVTIGYK